jgi:hypothetical protein
MGKNNNPMDVLISNIKADQTLLEEKTNILEEAKDEQRKIVSRLKEYKKDIQHMKKYLSEEQKAEVESLGLDLTESTGTRGALNKFSQVAIDSLMKAKGNKMTNSELFQAYVDSIPVDEEAESYTQFNVKIRQLFSQGRIEKKQIDSNKASRDDIISLIEIKAHN